MTTDHEFFGVAGDPERDECTFGMDAASDDPYCGETAAAHEQNAESEP